MTPFKLPQDFLLGTATSSLQIEGGDENNNWYEWSEKGRIKDGSHCIRANDHYNRVQEDIDLMTELNTSCYRMGLEWSRLEPNEGCFSSDAVHHYRSELKLLKEKGIQPLVTLFHFSYPLWFSRTGAFEIKACIERFKRYALFCVESFGDLVSEWITINEPNVFAFKGYIEGEWPPGKKSFKTALQVMKNLALCHIEAYEIIHQVRKERGFQGETRVGVAHHLRVFDPAGNNLFDKLVSRLVKALFQDAVIKATVIGRFSLFLGSPLLNRKGTFCDFLGINYYTRSIVKATIKGGYTLLVKEETPVNDLGWELYPEGLYRICKEYFEKYNLPIYITENGTCDANDSFRISYIADHLYQVSRLTEENIPVKRYYYWTLMDNFEWAEGESAPFGLIKCDFESQKRTMRRSGRFFSIIGKKKELDKKTIDELSQQRMI